MFDVLGGDPSTQVNGLGTATALGDVITWTLTEAAVIEGVTIDSSSASMKEDPFVTNNIVVTNNTGATQTFIATVLLPIPAFNYDEVVFSSLGVTATDSNGDGTLNFAQSGATPIYQGTVNGSTVLPLNPLINPITLADCLPSFNGCSATSSNGIASQAAGPGVATQIGITLTFTLSPGDSAGITSRFEIVPELSTVLLGGMGLLGLWITGSRRS